MTRGCISAWGIEVGRFEIYWPNGLQEQYKKIAANQLVTLREGVGNCAQQGLGAIVEA